MMRRTLFILMGFCVVGLFVTNSSIHAISSKTLAPYRGYLWTGLDYSGYAIVRGDEQEGFDVVSHFLTNQIYFGYGIYPHVSISFLVKLAYTKHEDDEDYNVGDGRITIKYEVFEQYTHLIPGIALFSSVQSPLSNYSPHKENAIGEQQTEFEFGLVFDYSWELPFFPLALAVAPGYRLRITSATDQFFLGAEVSTELNSYLGLKLKSYFHYSFSGINYRGEKYEKIIAETGNEPIPSLRSIFSNFEIEFEYHISSHATLGAQLGYIFYVENAPELYRVGFSYGRPF